MVGEDEVPPPPPTSKRLMIPCLLMVLASSLALNAIFAGTILYVHNNNKGELEGRSGWSKEAAERVAAISCSGHGTAFLDGVVVEDEIACECFACFTGPNCSRVEADGCVADADRKHAASSAMMVSGWHRMSYAFDNNDSLMSHELEKHIRKLHALAGNAVTQGKFIVFGAGSTHLLIAAVHALSSLMVSNDTSKASSVKVVASYPFYPLYRTQIDYLKSEEFEFQGDAWLWKNNSGPSDMFIEFVTSPNNPDCQLNKAVLQGPSVRTIHDHAYYWPHYTAIPSPADEDLMIFTLSKLTGHAGSRFGWALIKDEAVYEKMMRYVELNTIGVSHETQLRALKLLKVVLEKGDGRELFEFAHATMRDRWQRLNQVFLKTQRFSLQHIPPHFCSFFHRVREASPAYGWISCNKEDDTDCTEVLMSAGIIGQAGSMFAGEVGRRYVRLSLLKSQDDFELLTDKIAKLVSISSAENGPKTM